MGHQGGNESDNWPSVGTQDSYLPFLQAIPGIFTNSFWIKAKVRGTEEQREWGSSGVQRCRKT